MRSFDRYAGQLLLLKLRLLQKCRRDRSAGCSHGVTNRREFVAVFAGNLR